MLLKMTVLKVCLMIYDEGLNLNEIIAERTDKVAIMVYVLEK